MKNLIFLLFVASSCQSCHTWPSPVAPTIPTAATMVGHNYGSMSDAKALQILKAWGEGYFADPYSVKYKITQSPRQGWGRQFYQKNSDTPELGWIFKATTHGKNEFGAYRGIQEHVYLVSDGNVTKLTDWYPNTYNSGGLTRGLLSEGRMYGYR